MFWPISPQHCSSIAKLLSAYGQVQMLMMTFWHNVMQLTSDSSGPWTQVTDPKICIPRYYIEWFALETNRDNSPAKNTVLLSSCNSHLSFIHLYPDLITLWLKLLCYSLLFFLQGNMGNCMSFRFTKAWGCYLVLPLIWRCSNYLLLKNKPSHESAT